MTEPDIVTNTSPFGSSNSTDKEPVNKPENNAKTDLIEILQTKKAKPPKQHTKTKLPLIGFLLLLSVGMVALSVWLIGPELQSTRSQDTQATDVRLDSTSDNDVPPALFLNLIEGTRHFLAVGMVMIVFVLSCLFLIVAIRKSLEAIGRNPMASRKIRLNFLLISLILLATIGMGLGVAYLLFYGNLPSTHSRITNPTPPPNLPEDTLPTVFTTNCLTVAIPFKSTYPKLVLEDDRCSLYFHLTQPIGEFTLTYRREPEHAFEEDPSVTMRRANPEKYTEFEFTQPRFSRIMAFKTPTEATYFLRDNDNNHFELSFHKLDEGFASEITPELVYYLLDSLQLPNSPNIETLGVSEPSAE